MYLALVSDHGMVDVTAEERLNLERLLVERWGRRATARVVQDGVPAERARYFAQYDTVVCHQNGRAAFLYFRSPRGWTTRPTPEQVEEILTAPAPADQLWNQVGIELVTYLADADTALLRSSAGTARLRQRRGAAGVEFAYEPAPDDVLGYCRTPQLARFVAAGFHGERAWLGATAQQCLPEVVPALLPLLQVRRAGEVVVFAAPGYSFIPERGGHGGLRRDEMRMTFMLAGPDIPRGGRIAAGRAVDLAPTLLELLHCRPEGLCLDGISLVEALRAAEPGAP